jgi:voltage-gated potassium channel
LIKRLRRTISQYLLPRRHTALLVAIVAAFAVRPLIGNAGIAPAVFSVALLLLLLVALYAIQVDELVGEGEALLAQKRRRSLVGWILAAFAILERVAATLAPTHRMLVLGSVAWLLFIAYVTWSVLLSVLKQKEVTGETIAMSVSVYLLMGLAWGLLYIVLFQIQPDAFNLAGPPTPTRAADVQPLFPTFVYFSLTTLSTIGFGDITPVSLQARYAAVAEGITGQFYLAILVARLVGLQMSRSADRG